MKNSGALEEIMRVPKGKILGKRPIAHLEEEKEKPNARESAREAIGLKPDNVPFSTKYREIIQLTIMK